MDSSSRFIVPLDTFDLKSLLNLPVTKNQGSINNLSLVPSSRSFGYSDLTPIWSEKPAIDTVYYEFEIKSLPNTCNEDGFVQSRCSNTNENSQYCYICDIPVPSDYMQLHNAGVKHRTCAAILSHALHRANQHMTQSISLAHADPTAKTQSVFEAHFCDECATVINKEIKGEHEITVEHIKAVKHDRQLQAFLALFTDKVVIEDNNNNVSNNNENGDENLKHEDLGSETLNLREERIVKDKIEEVEETIDYDKPYKAATVDYKEDFVLLKTLKGELLRIPTDNYQGFSRLAHYVQCRVCREMVVDTAAHKTEPRHVELVTAAVTDRDCIRPLNDMLNHCILCNDIIYDPLFHSINNKQHNILLKQSIVPSNGKEKEDNADEHYCKYCNLAVERALKKRHKKSLDHRLNMWNANTGIHHHLKATEVLCEILCKVCNIVLENHQECLDEHLRTFDHEKNYEAILVSNKIRKIGDCLNFCQICNIRLVDREELHHIAGAKHVAKIQKWQESVLLDSKKEHALLKLKEDETVLYDSDVSDSSDEISADELTGLVFEKTQPNHMMELSNEDQVKCKVCDVIMVNDTDVINRHIQTNNHKFNYDTILNYNKLRVIEGSNEYKFYCEYCKGQVKDKSEIDHINDYLHSCERDFIKQLQSLNGKMSDDTDLNSNTKDASNANDDNIDIENTDITGNANRNAYYCDICNINLENLYNVKTHYEGKIHKSNLDKTFIEPPKDIHYLMEVKNKTHQCKVCRVKVPNNIQNIQDHLGGRNHNNTYNFLLNFNKIKKVNGSFYCEICNVNVMETLEIDHIDTSSHITKRSKYQNKTVDNKKDIAVVKHDPKTKHDKKTIADKVNSVNNYYCDVCNVSVTNYQPNIKEHTSGLRHKANINKMMSNHSISLKKKNTYYCDLCKSFFSKASVMKHVHSEKHKSLLAK